MRIAYTLEIEVAGDKAEEAQEEILGALENARDGGYIDWFVLTERGEL